MDDLILAAAATGCGVLVDDEDVARITVIDPKTLRRLAKEIVRLHEDGLLYVGEEKDGEAV